MGRGVDDAPARNLFSDTGHDEAFIERVLSIPEERRGKPRRAVAAPVETAEDATGAAHDENALVSLGAADIAALHRLRFESETGMHRMTMAECPADFTRFGLVHEERDGTLTITLKGRQALKHFACVRALDSVRLRLDAIPMSDEVKSWLVASGYLERIGNGCEVTALGLSWLELHRPPPADRPLS